MRGERDRGGDDPIRPVRFITACAGNAYQKAVESGAISVHPRMRGERIENLPDINIRSGSSPHTRGTLEGQQMPLLIIRFIPACAGNATQYIEQHQTIAVHPRMRGER